MCVLKLDLERLAQLLRPVAHLDERLAVLALRARCVRWDEGFARHVASQCGFEEGEEEADGDEPEAKRQRRALESRRLAEESVALEIAEKEKRQRKL